MLNKMREQASSFFAKVLLGLLVVSFAVWGIADIFRGYGSSTLAVVGSQEITPEEFRTALNRQLEQISAQAKRPISMADAHAMGIDSQVLGQLVAEAALNQRTHDLGLAIPDQTIAKEVMAMPAFQGPDGKFDHQRFLAILQNAGFSEQSFVANQRAFMLRRQLLDGLTGGVKTPPPLLTALHRYQTEQRSVRYVVLGPQAVAAVPPPDDKALQAFFDAHKAEFRTEERRSIVALPVSVDILAKHEEVTDKEIAARYDDERARFTTPEKRTVERITFKSMEDAKAASAKIKSGTSFAELAKERGLSQQDITLGTVTRGQIIDSAIGEAAFALAAGGVSEPVQGQFSPAIVHVTAIQPAATKPLSEVRDQVRHEVADAKARQDLQDLRDAIEDDRGSGATLTEIATKRHLQLVHIDHVNAHGVLPNGGKAPGPGLQPLLTAAFQTTAGADNDPVRLDDTGYIWYNVTNVEPARGRTLAEAHGDVVAAWHREQVRERLQAKSQDVLKALRAGTTTLQQVAGDSGGAVREAGDISRVSQQPPEGFAQSAVSAVFSTADNGFGVADAANTPARVIFQVSKVRVPKFDAKDPAVVAMGNRLDQVLQNDLATEYVLDLQNAYGVRVSQTAMAAVTGTSNGE